MHLGLPSWALQENKRTASETPDFCRVWELLQRPAALFVNARPVKGPPRAWVPCPRGSPEDQGASERRAVTPDATGVASGEAVVFSDELALVLLLCLVELYVATDAF